MQPKSYSRKANLVSINYPNSYSRGCTILRKQH
uniref:Uncharacterized protein n=1 Tax=Arundo donax TaxID=35708 RepID=A0A0A9ADG4_ARUDO